MLYIQFLVSLPEYFKTVYKESFSPLSNVVLKITHIEPESDGSTKYSKLPIIQHIWAIRWSIYINLLIV
jgi:hypothetical protein